MLTKDILQGRCVVVLKTDNIQVFDKLPLDQFNNDAWMDEARNPPKNTINFIWLLQRLAKGDGYKDKKFTSMGCRVCGKPSQSGNSRYCPHCKTMNDMDNWLWPTKEEFHSKPDSGLLVLLDEGVYVDSPLSLWYSNAAKKEYEYCKTNFIEVRSQQHPEVVL